MCRGFAILDPLNKEGDALQNVVNRINKARYAFSLLQSVCNSIQPSAKRKLQHQISPSMYNSGYEQEDYKQVTTVCIPMYNRRCIVKWARVKVKWYSYTFRIRIN